MSLSVRRVVNSPSVELLCSSLGVLIDRRGRVSSNWIPAFIAVEVEDYKGLNTDNVASSIQAR